MKNDVDTCRKATRNPADLEDHPLLRAMIPNVCFVRTSSSRKALGLVLLLAVLCLWNGNARADFRLCNNTSSRVGIALGYKDAEGWTTEGWWNISSRSCETLLKGALVARYYYIYALDYDRGGEWSGQAFMCSRDKEFTIKGTDNCLARGFDRTGFFEVDTGEQRAWTVQLTDANEQPAQQRVPGLPGTVGPGGNVPGLNNNPLNANPPGAAPTPGATGLPPAAAPGSKP